MTTYAYARVSTDEQARGGTSCRRQADLLLSRAPDAVLVVDDGYSGSSESSRPGWQRILDAVQPGDTVLATDLSRLHRNSLEAIAFARRCEAEGVFLVTLHDNIDTRTAMGKLVFGLMAQVNEHKSNETKEKTRDALDRKRRRGEKLGGTVPYGYDLVEGALVPNEREQEALRLMRRMRAQGYSSRQIGYELIRAGHTTKQGHRYWHPKVILDILKRPA